MICVLDIKKKKKLRKPRERYQNLTEEEKKKKRKYVRKRYKYLTETEKQRLFEYRKIYYEIQTNNCNVAQWGFSF